MSKSKKKHTPQVDPRVLTRPRLDALFERLARGELDDDGLLAGTQALMAEVGHRPLLDALVKRMEGTPEAERETILSLVPRLKSREVIDYLWQQVKKPHALSLDAKATALIVLKQMGEDVDLKDPARYFSARDIKPGDIKSVEDLMRTGVRGLARSLREARDPAEVEAFMLRVNRMPAEADGGSDILLSMMQHAESGATDLEADFIYALAHTTPFPEVRQRAEQTLARLAARGVKPVSAAVLGLGQDQFYAAYTTDPNHPWQQSVTVAWQRAGGAIQALVFLLDFGVPWRGAIKDMFPIMGMSPSKFQREFVDRTNEKLGEPLYRVSLARAQTTIADALEANRQYKVALPKDFNEFRHLVDRWVLHPPAAVIEADTTDDELAALPLTPDRSDKPIMVDVRDPERDGASADEDEEEWEEELPAEEVDEFYDFEHVLEDVESTYDELETAWPWWESEWVRDYLASLSPQPYDLERFDDELEMIAATWLDLRDFILYLDDYAHEIHTLADIRGFHLSDYLSENAVGWDEDDGRSRAEAVRDFFTCLAQHGLIASDLPLLSELAQMLAQPDQLNLLSRPEPRGGEIAVWFPMFGADERDEPFTYNEWWMALVLERRFKRNWERCRREAGRKPDSAAKLALLDQLENRLAEDSEYLDDLNEERAPGPEDYQSAENWFERESVSTASAW